MKKNKKKLSKLLKLKKLYKKLISLLAIEASPDVAKRINGPSIRIPVNSKRLEIKNTT
jgi:hypothetical protein